MDVTHLGYCGFLQGDKAWQALKDMAATLLFACS